MHLRHLWDQAPPLPGCQHLLSSAPPSSSQAERKRARDGSEGWRVTTVATPHAPSRAPHRALLSRRVPPEGPFYPLPKWPRARAIALATKIASTPAPSHRHEHNTIGTRFKIFEMALGPLWRFVGPNKYIREGARRKRTHPNDNTTPSSGCRQTAAPHACCVRSPPPPRRGIHVLCVTGTQIQKLEGHTASVNSVALSADASTLASNSSDNTIGLWDVKSGAV